MYIGKTLVVCCAVVMLMGCAAERLQASKDSCVASGHSPNTQRFNACVQAEVNRREAEFDRRFLEMNQQRVKDMQPPPASQDNMHTYVINGKVVTCTTLGSITNCR